MDIETAVELVFDYRRALEAHDIDRASRQFVIGDAEWRASVRRVEAAQSALLDALTGRTGESASQVWARVMDPAVQANNFYGSH